MDVASVAPSVSPGITSQQVREASQRANQNEQVAKERSAQTDRAEKTGKADQEAAAKAARAADEQAKAAVAAPKPVVNTHGQTTGTRINITA